MVEGAVRSRLELAIDTLDATIVELRKAIFADLVRCSSPVAVTDSEIAGPGHRPTSAGSGDATPGPTNPMTRA